jgi:hypothetical protein
MASTDHPCSFKNKQILDTRNCAPCVVTTVLHLLVPSADGHYIANNFNMKHLCIKEWAAGRKMKGPRLLALAAAWANSRCLFWEPNETSLWTAWESSELQNARAGVATANPREWTSISDPVFDPGVSGGWNCVVHALLSYFFYKYRSFPWSPFCTRYCSRKIIFLVDMTLLMTFREYREMFGWVNLQVIAFSWRPCRINHRWGSATVWHIRGLAHGPEQLQNFHSHLNNSRPASSSPWEWSQMARFPYWMFWSVGRRRHWAPESAENPRTAADISTSILTIRRLRKEVYFRIFRKELPPYAKIFVLKLVVTDAILSYPRVFIDSVLTSKGNSRLRKHVKPLGSVYIPYVEAFLRSSNALGVDRTLGRSSELNTPLRTFWGKPGRKGIRSKRQVVEATLAQQGDL